MIRSFVALNAQFSISNKINNPHSFFASFAHASILPIKTYPYIIRKYLSCATVDNSTWSIFPPTSEMNSFRFSCFSKAIHSLLYPQHILEFYPSNSTPSLPYQYKTNRWVYVCTYVCIIIFLHVSTFLNMRLCTSVLSFALLFPYREYDSSYHPNV